MTRTPQHRLRALLAGFLLAGYLQAAGAVSISQVPLFIGTGATPNVMLLIDNSGSMDNAIWDDGFNPDTTYPSWANYSCSHSFGSGNPCWTARDGSVILGQLWDSDNGSCSNGRVRGVRNGLTRCLVLPDPAGGGNTRYSGNYLNYLFHTYANVSGNSGRNLSSIIPNQTRIQVARSVAASLVSGNSNLAFGLASFNPPTWNDSGPGGRIDAACGTSTASLLNTIDDYRSEANTPLAETLYEITRYFRGMSSYYNNGSYTSPIRYRCQKNFTIVITDGFPTHDSQFPANDPADTADTGRSLPDWDGESPSTSAGDYPNFPAWSDGFQPQGGPADEGHTLYLDDVARFARDTDLRPTGNDDFGVSFNDPEFSVQNLNTYTVGFAVNNQMLADAAEAGDGLYFTADNEAQLIGALQSAISHIIARTSSAASVATNSTRLVEGSLIFQARFSSADWSGEFRALEIDTDGSVDVETPAWRAENVMPAPGSRNLVTYRPDLAAGNRGVAFAWNNLNAAQQAALNAGPTGVYDGNGQARLAYLRGERGNEAPAGIGLRARATVLGDIVNSDPAFAGQQNYGFDVLPGTEGSSYKGFRTSASYTSRPATVYVAANDGMLHAFDAQTGVERFAFVPNAVYANLPIFTSPGYAENHRFIHDGSPRVMDAWFGGAWRTVLVGSLGAGGRAVYALDVTSPTGFGPANVLWEFSSSNDADLGYSLPQATIARLYNGRWAAIVGNGYNGASGRAVLFVIDLETGAVIRKIDTGAGSDNGLSSPLPVDVDGDRITDFVYAGDLRGNLWKFDLTSANPNNWNVAFGNGPNRHPLFTACSADPCTSSNHQPITARPDVGLDPQGGYFVYFGTGRYFAVGDNTHGGGTQSFYAIRDPADKDAVNPQSPAATRGQLLRQQVVAEQVLHGRRVRITSDASMSATDQGWYMDLPAAGERQVSTPQLRGGRIIFTTVIPSTDPCGFGGTSWTMEVDAITGSRPSFSPYDLNMDGQFNEDDFGTVGDTKVAVSGIGSEEGIIESHGIIADGNVERMYASGSSGGIDTVDRNAGDQRGRQSWREIR